MEQKIRQTAKKLEDQADDILAAFTEALKRQGIEDIEVVSFAVRLSESMDVDVAKSASPCPVRCVVLPDGRVRCEPQC